MNYILDTNIVTGYINGESNIFTQLRKHRSDGIFLCAPIYYESMRGLIRKKATTKIATLQTFQFATWMV